MCVCVWMSALFAHLSVRVEELHGRTDVDIYCIYIYVCAHGRCLPEYSDFQSREGKPPQAQIHLPAGRWKASERGIGAFVSASHLSAATHINVSLQGALTRVTGPHLPLESCASLSLHVG